MHAATREEDSDELPSVEGRSERVRCHRQRDRKKNNITTAGTNYDFTSDVLTFWDLVSLLMVRTTNRIEEVQSLAVSRRICRCVGFTRKVIGVVLLDGSECG